MTHSYTCIWCEDAEAEHEEFTWSDPNYDNDRWDSSSYDEYRCGNCGCIFLLGTHTLTFSHIAEQGDPEKAVTPWLLIPEMDRNDK